MAVMLLLQPTLEEALGTVSFLGTLGNPNGMWPPGLGAKKLAPADDCLSVVASRRNKHQFCPLGALWRTSTQDKCLIHSMCESGVRHSALGMFFQLQL